MSRKFLCDGCQAEIREKIVALKVDTGKLKRRALAYLIDLCPACVDSFEEWLDSRKPAEVPSLESPPEIRHEDFPM
jgi:hypothetical protein